MPSKHRTSIATPCLQPFRGRLAVTLLMMLCTSSAVLQAAPERVGASVSAEWILARLQRPLPASTPFLELRGSRLLKAPLRIGGRYLRPDADTLVRDVSSPYVETTTLHGGEVQIVRKGQSVRRFQLSRAPELAALQASFGALLSGDRVQLERHYTLASSGQTARWQLVLKPKDAAMKTTLREIVLHGRGAELRCIETIATKGEPQRTLLAGAAAEAATLTDAQSPAVLCDGSGRG